MENNPVAFACASDSYGHQSGMDLRDWFAGQALVGIMANPERWKQIADDYKNGKKTYEQCSAANAVKAYSLADAMLAERQRKDTPMNNEAGQVGKFEIGDDTPGTDTELAVAGITEDNQNVRHYNRIEVYGHTLQGAQQLRNRILVALRAQEPPGDVAVERVRDSLRHVIKSLREHFDDPVAADYIEHAITALTTLAAENARLKAAGQALVDACEQMAEDTAPMFAEMQLGRGRGPYSGKQIGEEMDALRALLPTPPELEE